MYDERIPVFKGKKNLTVFRSTNGGVLDFEGSKIYVEEFHLKIKVLPEEGLDSIEMRIRQLEGQILARFFDDDFLYLTTRNDCWQVVKGHCGEVFYHATVSATYMKMVKAFDEFTTKLICGK